MEGMKGCNGRNDDRLGKKDNRNDNDTPEQCPVACDSSSRLGGNAMSTKHAIVMIYLP